MIAKPAAVVVVPEPAVAPETTYSGVDGAVETVAKTLKASKIAQIIDAVTRLLQVVKGMTQSQVMSALLLLVVLVLAFLLAASTLRTPSPGITPETIGMLVRDGADRDEKNREAVNKLAENIEKLTKAVNKKFPDTPKVKGLPEGSED